MENGTLVFIENTSDLWYHNLVFRCIKKVSGSRWTHVGTYFEKEFFEFSHPFGAMLEKKHFENDDMHMIKPPNRVMTDIERQKGRAFIRKHLTENTRYNYWKLIFVFPWMYPTRKFWDKIKFCPFGSDFLWGMVCSVGMGAFFIAIGWDILPGRTAETMTPGCLVNSQYHK